MPHRIDIDSIHAESFLLLNLAYAAPVYSERHPGVFRDDDESGDDAYYVSWLRYMLSEKLLTIAIKARILMDILHDEQRIYSEAAEEPPFDLAKLQASAISTRQIAFYDTGKRARDLRDCCNRVIHASEIIPSVAPSREEIDRGAPSVQGVIRYWNGEVVLHGEERGTPWIFTLCISDFCLAMEAFLCIVEESVDLHRIYKYDNQL